MSKLGKDGVVPYPTANYGEHEYSSARQAWDAAALAQRDAMLELFEEWVAECPCYVRVRLEERIAALRAGKESNG